MHADEVLVDEALVRRLVDDAFPDWSGLEISRVRSSGTVNVLFRLGADLQVRLQRSPRWSPDLDRQFTWLPRLAPSLPLLIPEPVARADPAHGYPFEWSVFRWIEGDTVELDTAIDLSRTARALGEFIGALQAFDGLGAPPSGNRTGPLADMDTQTRHAIEAMEPWADVGRLESIWDDAVAADRHRGPSVWVHSDLWHTNLLARSGDVCAVIDFEEAGLGDPSVDLISAWSVLDAPSRSAFRSILEVDDHTWARGWGWALRMAVLAIPYYAGTNPVIVANGQRMIEHLVTDI